MRIIFHAGGPAIGTRRFLVRLRNPFICLIVVLLAGCTVQLAPAYDASIVNGLASANLDMQTLFTSMGAGVGKDTFGNRAGAYSKAIGELNALEIQVKSRPTPTGTIDVNDLNGVLRRAGVPQIVADPNLTDMPSARAIHDTADTLLHMRDLDSGSGLRGDGLRAFVNQADIFISQATAYEAFLKR